MADYVHVRKCRTLLAFACIRLGPVEPGFTPAKENGRRAGHITVLSAEFGVEVFDIHIAAYAVVRIHIIADICRAVAVLAESSVSGEVAVEVVPRVTVNYLRSRSVILLLVSE